MSQRIEYLDSLRGLAATQVLIDHYLILFPVFWAAQNHGPIQNPVLGLLTYSPLHLLWAGPQAVILFFVLSGFVLALPYFGDKPPLYAAYLVRRFFRIYVPYIVVISFSAILLFAGLPKNPMPGTSGWFTSMWSHPVNAKEYLDYALMRVHNLENVDSPAWSLTYEMRISIFFPLICLLVLGLNRWIVLGLGAFLAVFSLVMVDHFPYWQEATSTVYFSSFFVFGCVLAKYKEDVKTFVGKFKNWQKLLLVLGALGLYNLEWEMGLLSYWGLNLKHDHIVLTLAPGIAAVLVIICALTLEPLQRLLHHKILLWVGKVSYSLYLTHVVVLAAAVYFLPDAVPLLARVILGALISFPVAALSYQFLERPCIDIGHSLAKRITNKKRLESEKIPMGGLPEES
jgi:peptidoglycan/LPS O-acetylase OafA/YrhL